LQLTERVRRRSFHAELLAGATGLPEAESLDARFPAGPLLIRAQRTLRYRDARPCAPPAT